MYVLPVGTRGMDDLFITEFFAASMRFQFFYQIVLRIDMGLNYKPFSEDMLLGWLLDANGTIIFIYYSFILKWVWCAFVIDHILHLCLWTFLFLILRKLALNSAEQWHSSAMTRESCPIIIIFLKKCPTLYCSALPKWLCYTCFNLLSLLVAAY